MSSRAYRPGTGRGHCDRDKLFVGPTGETHRHIRVTVLTCIEFHQKVGYFQAHDDYSTQERTMLRQDILPNEIRRTGLQIPVQYYRVWELGLHSPDPWRLMDLTYISYCYDQLRRYQPHALLVPFATNTHVIACFVASFLDFEVGQVVLVAWKLPRGEFVRGFDDFLGWYSAAVGEMLKELESTSRIPENDS
jgi:hypothetical protein